jgi:hypothetical protein
VLVNDVIYSEYSVSQRGVNTARCIVGIGDRPHGY